MISTTLQNETKEPESVSYIKTLAGQRQKGHYNSCKDEEGETKASQAMLYLWQSSTKDQVAFFSTPGVIPVLAGYGLTDSVLYIMDKLLVPSCAKVLEAPDVLTYFKREAVSDEARGIASKITRRQRENLSNLEINFARKGFQKRHNVGCGGSPLVQGSAKPALIL